MEAEQAQNLPESVLFRIAKGDAKGRAYGTPRNPRAPTIDEFNPRIVEIAAGELSGLIVSRKHGIFPDQARQVGQMTNEDLIRFRLEDPISATRVENGLSLTGGIHRTNEISQRVQDGQMDAAIIVKVLIHD
jgi:hypothetical protein